MNILIISIGSNENSETNISLCRQLLCEMFDRIYFSDISITTPYGVQYKNNFSNLLACAHTDREKEDIESSFKYLERKIGRQPQDKKNGIVKIDIDLIKWNDIVLKPDEWERDYINKLLPSLQQTITTDF